MNEIFNLIIGIAGLVYVILQGILGPIDYILLMIMFLSGANMMAYVTSRFLIKPGRKLS